MTDERRPLREVVDQLLVAIVLIAPALNDSEKFATLCQELLGEVRYAEGLEADLELASTFQAALVAQASETIAELTRERDELRTRLEARRMIIPGRVTLN